MEMTMFQLKGNTVLITGGGSGIGRALAEALHSRGNKVIITGRNPDKLSAVEKANPGIVTRQLDVDDTVEIKAFARQIIEEYPTLNMVVNNAGIMRREDVRSGDTETAEATIATNFLAPIRVTAAFLPHLLRQPSGAVVLVSSGLAFVPLGVFPTYCATKASIHAYAQTLRHQLIDSSVQVIELVPPMVQTELTGPAQAVDPQAMPLDEYISETIKLLDQPEPKEILVERALFFRDAEREGRYDQAFGMVNTH
jgi:uncharacterized oxidoreductase